MRRHMHMRLHMHMRMRTCAHVHIHRTCVDTTHHTLSKSPPLKLVFDFDFLDFDFGFAAAISVSAPIAVGMRWAWAWACTCILSIYACMNMLSTRARTRAHMQERGFFADARAHAPGQRHRGTKASAV